MNVEGVVRPEVEASARGFYLCGGSAAWMAGTSPAMTVCGVGRIMTDLDSFSFGDSPALADELLELVLVDFIMSKDCPVSASLTDADKAKLLRIKQEAIRKPRG